jgi:hypothetical protein
VDPYFHPPIHLHGIVLSTETTLTIGLHSTDQINMEHRDCFTSNSPAALCADTVLHEKLRSRRVFCTTGRKNIVCNRQKEIPGQYGLCLFIHTYDSERCFTADGQNSIIAGQMAPLNLDSHVTLRHLYSVRVPIGR